MVFVQPMATTVAVTQAVPRTAPKPRLDSIDTLRGIVIVLMALDHTRDFFSRDLAFDPTDLARTYPALYLTRWITHFCAPVFLFLAGTSAFLSTTRGKTTRELSWFLFTRGLWCIILELTWIRCFGWRFNFDFTDTFGIVFWAIGWSMIALSVLVFLPLPVITGFGVVLIASHNLFDAVEPEAWGSLGWLWKILHSGGSIELGGGCRFGAGYPLIPWIGVMAVGYGFGRVMIRPEQTRRRWLSGLGSGLIVLFILVRALNVYGDSQPWSAQTDAAFTLFSFLNCTKYPPSLLYLLMTLGPSLLILAWLDRGTPKWLQPICVFGRVPLFFYLLHLPLIHGLAVISSYAQYGRAGWWFANNPADAGNPDPMPPGYGFGLPIVYLVWLVVVLALYPACRWFAGVKRRRRDVWLSYF